MSGHAPQEHMQERTTAPLCMSRSLQIVRTQHAGLCMPSLRARLAPQVICSAFLGLDISFNIL